MYVVARARVLLRACVCMHLYASVCACKWLCGSFYVATGSAEKGLVILASPELRMDVLRLSRTLSCNRQLCDNSSDGDDDYTISGRMHFLASASMVVMRKLIQGV